MKQLSYGRYYSIGLNPALVEKFHTKYGEAAGVLGREVFFRTLVALYLETGNDNIEAGITSNLVRPGDKPLLVKIFVSDHARMEIENRFHLEVPFTKQIRIILAAFSEQENAPPLNQGMRSRWNTAPPMDRPSANA